MALTNEGGIFAVINGIIEGLPEAAGKLGNGVVNFANNVADGVTTAAGHVFDRVTSVGAGVSITAHEPAVAPAKAQAIAEPARDTHDVDPSELFTFSAPTFNSIPLAARATGQSAGV